MPDAHSEQNLEEHRKPIRLTDRANEKRVRAGADGLCLRVSRILHKITRPRRIRGSALGLQIDDARTTDTVSTHPQRPRNFSVLALASSPEAASA